MTLRNWLHSATFLITFAGPKSSLFGTKWHQKARGKTHDSVANVELKKALLRGGGKFEQHVSFAIPTAPQLNHILLISTEIFDDRSEKIQKLLNSLYIKLVHCPTCLVSYYHISFFCSCKFWKKSLVQFNNYYKNTSN